MKLFIYPHPNSGTLAEKREAETSPGEGWLEMTEEAFEAWTEQQLAEGWTPVVPQPQNAYQPLPMWQVKVWMARKGIDLAAIPSIIASNISAGPAREEALIRWQVAPEAPFDHPLVALVARSLNISRETAWQEIAAV
jgi:hypothetical protein